MTESLRDKISDRLNRSLSIHPCRSWFDACLQHVNDTESSTISELDDYCTVVFHQILHSDLRNVVRNENMEGISDPKTTTTSTIQDHESIKNSILLRNAIEESIDRIKDHKTTTTEHRHDPSSSYSSSTIPTNSVTSTKVSLPSHFKLLVQIEELLDVSLNAEDRLKVGPSSLSSPTPVGNQRHRCLKMVLSDGYPDHHTNRSISSSAVRRDVDTFINTSNSILIAMELSPIPNLSVNSQPGVKILLRGAITIRMGILLLNEANSIVLGGCVTDLIPYQQKAREKAARIAGIGVDPTIKALIGNSQREVEDDQDEGEHASVDVTERSRTGDVTSNPSATHHGLRSNHLTNFPPSNSTRTLSTAVASAAAHSSHGSISRALHEPMPLPTIVSNIATNGNQGQATTSLIDNASNRTAANPYNKLQELTISSHPTTGSAEKNPKPRSHMTAKPMGFDANNEDGSTNLGNNVPSKSSILNTHNLARHNSTTSAGPSSLSSTTSITTATTGLHVNHLHRRLEEESNQVTKMDNNHIHRGHTHHIAVPPDDLQHNMNNDSQTSNDLMQRYSGLAISHPALYKVLSFGEFRALLQVLLKDPVSYSSHEGKIFIVPSKISIHQPPSYGFKIQKNKIWKSKSEKYYYTSTIRMTGIDVKDGESITCRLSNSILEKCIGIPADQLRVLNQNEETKHKGNAAISDGVKRALDQLRNLVSCNFKLLLSKDERFSSSVQSTILAQVDSDDQPIVVLNSYEIS